MHERRIPEWLRHAPAPSVRGFALLAGTEAIARGILISVFPLALYEGLGDAQTVSKAYFWVGVISLVTGLMVPFVTRFMPRRWVYSAGAAMFSMGALIATQGSGPAVVAGLLLIAMATVICFVCFNAYVLDYISKIELGRCETSRMFYSAFGWTVGPVLGVSLRNWWEPAPFVIAAIAAAVMLGLFLYLRLGNGKLITRAVRPAVTPLSYLPRFISQPRLMAGFLFATFRSCGWWVYVVYLPIFAIEAGLGDRLGGIVLSISNGFLFLTPFMLRWMRAHSIRKAVRTGFLMSGLLFAGAGAVSGMPWLAVLALVAGSFFLILLDMSAGLPFLMAVKPSERTEMSAIYSAYRDVSGILTPGAAWLVLLAAPLSGIFVAGGAGLLAMWMLAGRLHPRLGEARPIRMEEGPLLSRSDTLGETPAE